MTVGAIDLCQISQIDWMLEGWGRCCGCAGRALGFGHEGVALVAVPAHHPAVGANVLPVVAAEAATVVVMAQVVGMSLPIQLHFGECRAPENLLNLGDRVANLQLLGLCFIGIL